MKSKYYSHLDNVNLKVISLLIHKISALDDYLISHSFPRSESVAIAYLYSDYCDCVRRFNVLKKLKSKGKKVSPYVPFPFEDIAFYDED